MAKTSLIKIRENNMVNKIFKLRILPEKNNLFLKSIINTEAIMTFGHEKSTFPGTQTLMLILRSLFACNYSIKLETGRNTLISSYFHRYLK